MNTWQVAAVVLLAAQSAQSADIPANQFYRSGNTVSCGKPLPPDTDPTPPTYTACLRAGAIGIGDDLKAVEAHLGQALEPPRDSNGTELRLYAFDPSSATSYVVVGYESGRAATIQVVGPQPPGKLTFATIEVGDAMAKVPAALGNPSYQRCNLNTHQEVWTYEPFPFSFTLNEGAVTGFKLAAAPQFEGPFEPLKRLERLEC